MTRVLLGRSGCSSGTSSGRPSHIRPVAASYSSLLMCHPRGGLVLIRGQNQSHDAVDVEPNDADLIVILCGQVWQTMLKASSGFDVAYSPAVLSPPAFIGCPKLVPTAPLSLSPYWPIGFCARLVCPAPCPPPTRASPGCMFDVIAPWSCMPGAWSFIPAMSCCCAAAGSPIQELVPI